MKKAYVKPVLLMESFQPSDAIAGPCNIDVNFGDGEISQGSMCTYPAPGFDGVNLFVNINSACDVTVQEGNDKECYHIPTSNMRYFGS